MKNLSFIIFVFAALLVGSTITGCGGDDPVPTPMTGNTDTTEETSAKNQVTVGLVAYNNIETETERTVARYNSTSDVTEIILYGSDPTNGAIDFNIEVPGQTAKLFSREDNDGTAFQIGTGIIGDLKRKEYSALTTPFTITVTEYGAVGGRIKGTFSGKVKNNNTGQTLDISKGVFDIERKADL